jgi:hypothetical protein
MNVERSKWSGEGVFTQLLLDSFEKLEGVVAARVEDAPASRSEADYNFISNEIYVTFDTRARKERVLRFGFLPGSRTIEEQAMTMAGLDAALAADPDVGAADYADEEMLQYLRTERVIPPYQTRGYKLVELVRIYRLTAPRTAPAPSG